MLIMIFNETCNIASGCADASHKHAKSAGEAHVTGVEFIIQS